MIKFDFYKWVKKSGGEEASGQDRRCLKDQVGTDKAARPESSR